MKRSDLYQSTLLSNSLHFCSFVSMTNDVHRHTVHCCCVLLVVVVTSSRTFFEHFRKVASYSLINSLICGSTHTHTHKSTAAITAAILSFRNHWRIAQERGIFSFRFRSRLTISSADRPCIEMER